jgi:hypothetical protein
LKNWVRNIEDLAKQEKVDLKTPPLSLPAAIATELFNQCEAAKMEWEKTKLASSSNAPQP